MQISLNQNEIEAGIKMYIESRGISLTDRAASMDFTSTRKGNTGINVDVDLGEDATFSPAEMMPVFGISMTSKPNGGMSARRQPVSLQDVRSGDGQTSAPEPETETPSPVVEEAVNDAEHALTEEEEQAAITAKPKRTRRTKAEIAADEAEAQAEDAPAETQEDASVQEEAAAEPVKAESNLFAMATPSAEKPKTEPVSPGLPVQEEAPRRSLFG